MKKVVSYLDENIETIIMVFCLAVMCVCCIVQVVTRYLLSDATTWTEELAKYMFIWMVYMAISYGIKKNAHICVEVLVNILPAKIRPVILQLGNFVSLIYAVTVAYFGIQIASFIYASGQVSPAIGVPMGLVYFAVPIGFALSGIRLIQRIVTDFRAFAKSKEE